MKIKRVISIVAALALAVAVLSGCSKKDPNVPDGMKLASDPELATYTFFVPESWSIDTQNASTRAYCSGTDRSFIMVMTGEMQYTDSTVDDWWESGLSELKALYLNFELQLRVKRRNSEEPTPKSTFIRATLTRPLSSILRSPR